MVLRLAVVLAAMAVVPAAQSAAPGEALDAALGAFWEAEDAAAAAVAIDAIVATDPEFGALRERLAAGRSYAPDVPRGRLLLSRTGSESLEHRYMVIVPDDYDPQRRYPVRFFLHGGAQRGGGERDARWGRNEERIVGADRIGVFPTAWSESLWWQASQVENLAAIIERLQRTYNVDENRIYLMGASDGGTGVYFQAFRTVTRWAAFLPFISNPLVLTNPSIGVDGQMYVANLTNRAFFVVNGGRDPLYPIGALVPYIELFERAGVRLDFRVQREAGHTTSWWPAEAADMDAFIDETVRDPLPDRLAWETERTDRYHRIHWLMITELGAVPGESAFEELNTVTMRPPISMGVKMDERSAAGVRLTDVQADSVAGDAGLRRDDVVVRAGGAETNTAGQLRRALSNYGFGSDIPLTIVRDGDRFDVTLHVPERPEPRALVAFPHRAPSGRIELVRDDNTVRVRTRGVRRYVLLLSPAQFDLSKPVRVITNDRESFNGIVAPDAEVLLRWAARDNDRTMLFGAELEIEVGGR